MTSRIPPEGNRKISASLINEVPRFSVTSIEKVRESGIYTIPIGGLDFDLVLFQNTSHGSTLPLFVFFSGYIDRKVTNLPAFQRWSWHNRFPGHTLYISDPLLKMTDDIGLGWYIGTKESDLNAQIATVVRQVALNLGTPLGKVVYYGSSGGGFAALRSLIEIPEAQAVAINPQVILTNFEGNSLDRYLSRFFGGMSKKDFERLHSFRNSVLSRIGLIRESRVVYVQNTLDPHHMNQHFAHLFRQAGVEWTSRHLRNVELVLFEDIRGHGVGEPPEILEEILSHLSL